MDVALLLLLAALIFSGPWLLFRPRRRRSLALGSVSWVFSLALLWKASSLGAAFFGPTVLRVETTAPLVALTFDDGPTPHATARLREILSAHQVSATFFLTGTELAAHPELGRSLLADGHELGNHSWSHSRLIFSSPAELAREVEATDALLATLGQREPIAFRPPYGKRLLDLHAALGERPVMLWDIEADADRSVDASAQSIAEHVLRRAKPGSIILLHAMYRSRESTLEALPGILAGLKQRGLRATTLREVLDVQLAAQDP